MTNIGLIALDERPVNTRYPAMIGEIAGVKVLQPPPHLRSNYKIPADCDAIGDWLRDNATHMDALIVSIETLGYGGLILSRITHDPTSEIIRRLQVIREVKTTFPDLKIMGFNLITRISRANSDSEEPPYWTEYGNQLYRYSQLYDQVRQGQDFQVQLDQLEAEIPRVHRQDFVKRRLRNHAVNLTIVEMLAEDVIDTLVISSDDTSRYGFGSREKRWLMEWVEKLGEETHRLLLYPGADEVGCALLARALTIRNKVAPTFEVHYAIPEDHQITAPFEDGPVSLTVERQIRAVGGTVVENDGEFIVAVNTPSHLGEGMYNYTPSVMKSEREYRQRPVSVFVDQIKNWGERWQTCHRGRCRLSEWK